MSLRQLLLSEDYQLIQELGIPTTPTKAAQAFQEAFDLIGGIPRLAKWADKNPDKFFQLYSKLVPSSVQIEEKKDVTVTINWAGPQRLSYRYPGNGQGTLDVPAAGAIPALPQPSAKVVEPVHAQAGREDSGPGE